MSKWISLAISVLLLILSYVAIVILTEWVR